MSDFAEIATVAVTSVMAVFLFVVITPLIYVCLKVSQLVVRISKVATCTSQLSYIQCNSCGIVYYFSRVYWKVHYLTMGCKILTPAL